MKKHLSFISAVTLALGISASGISAAQDGSISITGDVTQDVTTMQTEDGSKSAASITGDANLIGFYFTQKNSNMRSGPGTSHAVMTTVPKGQEIYVDGLEGEWYRVNFTEGQIGYIFSTLLDKNPPK
ncbi:SH3 domain-containing protein [Curvivirga sp.]|uniref:SH3 domain-containing protein n=1 Tax=Curvivirga sp. TaxID=2856848 RepID=UPI003B5CEA09